MKPRKMWAWWDNERETFSHIYRHKKLVAMCFPYGNKVEEDRGKGKVVEVIVVPAELYDEQVASYIQISATNKINNKLKKGSSNIDENKTTTCR